MTGLSQSATVEWKNPDGSTITSGSDDYTITDEAASGGVQNSILTIGTSRLSALSTTSTFTCVVTSGEYTDSDASTNTMTLTKLTFNVEEKSKEVEENTSAVLSCVITGITEAVTTTWTDSSDADLAGNSDYSIDQGNYGSNSQTTTLTVTNGVSSDTTFSCKVTSTEWSKTDEATAVALNVYGMVDRKYSLLP